MELIQEVFAVLKAAESVVDMDVDIAREEHQLAAVEESDKFAESMEEMLRVDFLRNQSLERFHQNLLGRKNF